MRENGRDAVFIAGGCGMGSIMSMIRYARDEKLDKSMRLLYSCSKAEEFAFLDELNDVSSELDFEMVLTLTGEGSEWSGRRGRIDQGLLSEYDFSDTDVYLCGPPSMNRAMKDILKRLGVSEERIFYDRW